MSLLPAVALDVTLLVSQVSLILTTAACGGFYACRVAKPCHKNFRCFFREAGRPSEILRGKTRNRKLQASNVVACAKQMAVLHDC